MNEVVKFTCLEVIHIQPGSSADPQAPTIILTQIFDIITAEYVSVADVRPENLHAETVIPRKSVARCQPDISIAVLDNLLHIITRKAIGRGHETGTVALV